MKVLIVDNEKKLRDGLADLIELFCPEVKTIEKADGVESGFLKLKEYTPDILFLDVELDDGTGIDLLHKLSHIPFQIVFTTAHNKYAIDAFKFSALDFLLKPINPEELIKSVQKAKEKIESIDVQKQFNVLKEHFNVSKPMSQKIILKDKQSIYAVKIDDIIRCESKNTYTIFYLTNNTQIVITKPIKEYEELLEPMGFIRVHQSHLINKSKIERFDKINLTLILERNHSVPVAQRKKEFLLDLLNKF